SWTSSRALPTCSTHAPARSSPSRRARRMHPSERETDPSSQDPPPHSFLISIVLTGRNDGEGGAFLGRLIRTLRFNHQQLAGRGIAHEIVFVEWAPPSDRPRLFDLVFA